MKTAKENLMKKTLSLVLALVMLVGCVFTLASCAGSAYPKLEKAFIAEDFEVVTELDTITEKIKDELEKEELVVNPHLLVRKDGLNSASVLIIEFKSTEELVDAYNESETLKGFIKDVQNDEDAKAFYNALVEAGYAKGNCFVIPLTLLNQDDVTDIVKGA